MSIIEINCLVLRHSEEEIFTVHIPQRENISRLKQKNKQEEGEVFRGVAASQITLCIALKQFDEIKDFIVLHGPNLKASLRIEEILRFMYSTYWSTW